MRVPVVALITVLVVAPLVRAEEPEVTVPRLGEPIEVRVDMPEGETDMVATTSPDGRSMLIGFGRRSDEARHADTWTSLRLIDLRKGRERAKWDDLTLGHLPPAFSPDGRIFAFGTRKDATTLTVHVQACATARGIEVDVPHPEGSLGFAEVCGVTGNAQRVAISEPPDAAGGRHLMVYDLTGKRRIARFADVAEPYRGGRHSRVLLTSKLVAFHTTQAKDDGGRHYRLLCVELDTSRAVADLGAFVAGSSWRFGLTPDGSRLVNGNDEFDVEAVDVATGERSTLIAARDLYSHYFDVQLCRDGKRVVAWSDERKLLLARDLAGGDTIRVETDFRMHVLGISADGRWVYVRVRDKGIAAVDLDEGNVAGVVTEVVPDWVRITPDGSRLIAGTKDDKGWTFSIREITTP